MIPTLPPPIAPSSTPELPPPLGPFGDVGGRRRRASRVLVTLALVAAGAAAGGVTARLTDSDRTGAPAPSTASTASAAPVVAATSAPTAAAAAARTDVADLVAAALPAVVSIEVEGANGSAAGTGFVVSADGDIVTNAHVVADSDKVHVTFHDGTTSDADIVGVDRTDDLAVIRVAAHDLAALPLGRSGSLRVGQPVVAIGNALALTGGPTATEGIVSALDRTIQTNNGEQLRHMVQTDAAINPGNSGGPLLDLAGSVVGINSAGSSDAQNIGFAISIDGARPIIEQLEQGKTVTRAYLGVSTTPVDAQVQAQNGLAVDHGLLIVDVAGGSGAEAAGLQPGDVILSVDGTATNDDGVLRDTITAAGPGQQITLEIQRGKQQLELTATLSSHAA